MSAATVATDPNRLRQVFGQFPSGVVTVAALGTDGPIGLLVSSFTSVSLSPALVAVNIAHSSTTYPALREQSHWGISVLATHQSGLADNFRRPSSQRFIGIDWTATVDGAVLVDDAAATFTTRVDRLVPAGDHDIALLEVLDHTTAPSDPLLFHRSRFRRIDESS